MSALPPDEDLAPPADDDYLPPDDDAAPPFDEFDDLEPIRFGNDGGRGAGRGGNFRGNRRGGRGGDGRNRPREGAGNAGRVPPHNIQAEESLLGAMLLSRDAIASAVEVVTTDDFYKPAHGHIFDAITSLYAAGDPADPVTVAEELRRAGLLEAVGGSAALLSLQTNVPATTSAARYAKIIEENALLRRLIWVAGEVAERAYDLPDDVTKTVDEAETLMFEVAQRRVTDTTSPIGDILHDTLDRLEMLYERGESITGTPSGYVDLDEITAGLQPSALIVVGARPAMGKCLSLTSQLVLADTGERVGLGEVVRRGQSGEGVQLFSLSDNGTLVRTVPSAYIDDGTKPVFRVRTRLGREVTTTATHPFLTPKGWRPLSELRQGVRVAVPSSLPVFGTHRLPAAEVKLLAYLLADGCATGTGVRCTVPNDEVGLDLEEAAAAYDLEVLARRTNTGELDYRFEARSGPGEVLVERLRGHGLGGTSANTSYLPGAVFRLPREHLALFLSRLYAVDGSAYWRQDPDGAGYGAITFSTLSKPLAHDLQHLLLRFGLNARIRRTRGMHRGVRRLAYQIELVAADDLRRFAAEIGIFTKEAAVGAVLNGLDARDRGETPAVRATAPTPRRVALRRAAADAVADTLADDLASPDRHAGLDVYWDEVVEILPDGNQQVYDLTIPQLHNFVADDIIVHNTAFALGMAEAAALEGNKPVLFFSLEMSNLEVTQRILCSHARVDATRVKNGKLNESDWTKLTHAVGRLVDAPIYIDDNPNVTVMDIRAKARRLKSRQGDLGLVIVDYIQLMGGRGGAENRQTEVAEISRNLKLLARELECPVVALAQLNRQLEARQDKRPMLADLRESGSIEQDADVVLFLYRDEVYNPDTTERGTAEVIIAKHRAGPTGKVKLAWLDHYTKFANMAKGG